MLRGRRVGGRRRGGRRGGWSRRRGGFGLIGSVHFELDEVARISLVGGCLTVLTQIERIPEVCDEESCAEKPDISLYHFKLPPER
jgi:hypothetical protein